MKKTIVFILTFIMMIGVVSAAPFNLPLNWVLNNNGTSIDANDNGWPDYADNIFNASYADSSNNSDRLDGEHGSYYLNYDNMNAGSIADSYIDSSTTWNNKAATGACAPGYHVSNITSSTVTCTLDQDTTYSAGANLNLVGTIFSVDLDNLASALENGILLDYHNVTGIPTCSGTDKLTFDGTDLVCANDEDDDTQLTQEQVQDFAWNVLGGTQDGITVSYNDSSNTVDFVVDPIEPGAQNVSELGDVSLTSLADGEALVYNATSGLWENEVVAVDLSNYYTKTEVNNLNVSTFTNDAGYITSYTETDPIWTSEKSYYYNVSETYNQSEIDAAIDANSGVWNTSGDNIFYDKGKVSIGTDDFDNGINFFTNDNIRFKSYSDDISSISFQVNETGSNIPVGFTNVGKSHMFFGINSYPGYSSGFVMVDGGDPDDFGGDGWILSKDGTNDFIFINRFSSTNNERMRLADNGFLGIGTATAKNRLDVEGGAVVGSSYSGVSTAPTNGLLVEGDVGIGVNNPSTALEVAGTVTATDYLGDGSGLSGVITSETDPVWTADKSNYYNTTQADSNFVDISGDSMTGDLVVGGVGNITGYLHVDNIDVLSGTDINFQDGINIASGEVLKFNSDTQLYRYAADHLRTSDTLSLNSLLYGDVTSLANFTIEGNDDGDGEIYLNPSGSNVGVGTTNPTAQLEVNGTVKINDDLNMSNNNVTSVDCITFESGGSICSAS